MDAINAANAQQLIVRKPISRGSGTSGEPLSESRDVVLERRQQQKPPSRLGLVRSATVAGTRALRRPFTSSGSASGNSEIERTATAPLRSPGLNKPKEGDLINRRASTSNGVPGTKEAEEPISGEHRLTTNSATPPATATLNRRSNSPISPRSPRTVEVSTQDISKTLSTRLDETEWKRPSKPIKAATAGEITSPSNPNGLTRSRSKWNPFSRSKSKLRKTATNPGEATSKSAEKASDMPLSTESLIYRTLAPRSWITLPSMSQEKNRELEERQRELEEEKRMVRERELEELEQRMERDRELEELEKRRLEKQREAEEMEKMMQRQRELEDMEKMLRESQVEEVPQEMDRQEEVKDEEGKIEGQSEGEEIKEIAGAREDGEEEDAGMKREEEELEENMAGGSEMEGGQTSLENGPLLNIEIPSFEMERYSIMFGDFLDQLRMPRPPQDGDKPQSRPEGTEMTSRDDDAEVMPRLHLQRRATSPLPTLRTMLPPKPLPQEPREHTGDASVMLPPTPLSNEPREAAKEASVPMPTPAPLLRSSTAPVATNGLPWYAKKEATVSPTVHKAPTAQSRPPMTLSRSTSQRLVSKFNRNEYGAGAVDGWSRPSRTAGSHHHRYITVRQALDQPPVPKIEPALLLLASVGQTRPDKKPPSDVDDSDDDNDNEDDDKSVHEKVEISIARQVSVSQRPRRMIVPPNSALPQPGSSSTSAAAIEATARVVPGRNRRLVEAKNLTPMMAHLGSPGEGMYRNRQSTLVMVKEV